jgi:methyl-accepting chemotaxis protein
MATSKGVNVPVEVSTGAAVTAVDKLSTSFFRFRDNVAKSTKTFNVFANAGAKLFRRLARIRTAFFILATFLATRQIFNFFLTLGKQSASFAKELSSITKRLNVLKGILGDALTPTVKKLGDALFKLLQSALDFTQTEDYKDLIYIFDRVTVALFRIGKVIYNVTNLTGGFVAALSRMSQALIENVSVTGEWMKLKLTAWIQELTLGVSGYLVPVEQVAKAQMELADFQRKHLKLLKPTQAELDKMAESVKGMTDAIKDLISDSGEGGIIQTIGDGLAEVGENAGKAKNAVQSMSKAMSESLKRVRDKILDETFQTMFTRFLEGVRSAAEKFLGDTFLAVMQGKLSKVKDLFRALVTDIQRELSKLASRQLIQTVVGGIANMPWGSILGAGTTAGAGVLQNAAQPAPGVLQNAAQPAGAGSSGWGPYGQYKSEFPLPNVPAYIPPGPFTHTAQPFIGPQRPPIPPGPFSDRLKDMPFRIKGGLAHGGIVQGTQNVTAGEGGIPEAFVPLKGGNIPVSLSGGGRGGNVTLVIAPQVIDGASFGAWLKKESKVITDIVSAGVGGNSTKLRESIRKVRG